MAKPKKVVLREAQLAGPEEAHALLAEALDFPDYYGANLDALADCLGDVEAPTRVVVKRAKEHAPWFDGFVLVISDVAKKNDRLKCAVRDR